MVIESCATHLPNYRLPGETPKTTSTGITQNPGGHLRKTTTNMPGTKPRHLTYYPHKFERAKPPEPPKASLVWGPIHQEWLAYHKANWKPGTYSKRNQQAKDFYSWCDAHGITKPSDVTIHHIVAWGEDRAAAGISGATRIASLVAVKMLLDFCELKGLIGKHCNPVDHRWLPKIVKAKPNRQAFTYEQYMRVRKEAERLEIRHRIQSRAHHEELGLLVAIGWHTGLRLGDCCCLTWDSVNFDQEILVVRTQKKLQQREELVIPMEPELYALLLDRWNQGGRQMRPDGNYVLPWCAAKFQAVGSMAEPLNILFNKAGVRPLSFHSLRHAFVTRLINAGVDSIVIGSMTGQSVHQIATYAHVSNEAKVTALETARKSLHKVKVAEVAAMPAPKEIDL